MGEELALHFRQARVTAKGLRNYQIESGIVKTLLVRRTVGTV